MTVFDSTSPPPPPEVPAAAAGRDDLLEDFVAGKVQSLQQGVLRRAPSSMASLARLRRAVSTTPGADPTIWGDTFGGLPMALTGPKETPSHSEWAVHAALTLYAVHQQSQGDAMHRRKQTLGRAVGTLSQRLGRSEAVRKRFVMLGTAAGLPETLHHLRGLITQLRGEQIPLDYGLLAVDLRRLQRPSLAGSVRLGWGRDLHRVLDGTPRAPSPDDPTGDTQSPSTPTSTGEQ